MLRIASHILVAGLTFGPLHAAPSPAHAALPPVEEEEPAPEPPPTEEEIEAALEALEAGLALEAPEDRVAAVRAAGEVRAPELAEALADAVDPDEIEVSSAALVALGRMELEEARDELVRLAKRGKKLMANDQLGGNLIQGIGRFGNEKDLKLFLKYLDELDRPDTTRACLLSIANLRTDEALGELIDFMNRAPIYQGRRERNARHWVDLYFALKVLTGADPGKDRPAWQEWWNDNKRSFEVSAELPELDQADARLWNAYWGEPRGKDSPDRERGGGDGEGGERGGGRRRNP